MTIKVLFFAHYQDIVGRREIAVSVPEGSDLQTLAAVLTQQYPRLDGILQHGRAAVNAEFADAATLLHEGDEAAFMPPMSGGSSSRPLGQRWQPRAGG